MNAHQLFPCPVTRERVQFRTIEGEGKILITLFLQKDKFKYTIQFDVFVRAFPCVLRMSLIILIAEEYDAYIIVSFVNATLVLSIGETVEEVTDSGFLGTTPTLSCSALGEDALVQVFCTLELYIPLYFAVLM